MNNIITWFAVNGPSVVAALGAVIIAARLIVKLTPTPKDDSVLDSVVSFLKHVGLNIKDDSNA